MTREDALLYLPFKDEDELEDLYEDKLFEFKQKVLVAAPSTKLYQYHLTKLSKVHAAYLHLTASANPERTIEYTAKVNQDSLISAWRDFNRNKNELKLKLVSTFSFSDIEFILDCLIQNQKQFASIFHKVQFENQDETLIVGKEPDAMALEVEIDQFMSNGGGEIKSISKLDTANLLYQEANRLSLWLKTEKNVR